MRWFKPGETAVRRDLFRQKVWSAHTFQVIEDGADTLVLGCGPGAQVLAATTWIEWLLTGNEAARSQAIPNLARGQWELDHWPWRDTAHLQWVPPGSWFSVNAFYDLSDRHRLTQWYVDFQRPMCRTTIGFDTFDLLLDLVSAPDLSRWGWKDEAEYAHGRRLGVVSDADHEAVESAREKGLAMIESQSGPFAAKAGWRTWCYEPDSAPPALPNDVLTVTR